jgi:hypothetical protein
MCCVFAAPWSHATVSRYIFRQRDTRHTHTVTVSPEYYMGAFTTDLLFEPERVFHFQVEAPRQSITVVLGR